MTGHEVLLCRWTWTVSGEPLTEAEARREFGPRVVPWVRVGWFFRPATPASAARIRELGHRAVGEAVTTWMPPQSAITVADVPEPDGDWRPAEIPGT